MQNMITKLNLISPVKLALYIALPLLQVGVAGNAHAAGSEKGASLFAQRCASCHGTQGAGDGPVAAALPPEQKPRNLQLGQMKFATDDTKFLELLKKGGMAVGLSPMMPPQPDLSEADLKEIIAFVHSLKK